MKYVHPERWRSALVIYLAGGLVLGLCNRPLNLLAQSLGVRPGIGTAVNVNLFMSGLAVLVAFYYPLLRSIWVGSIVSVSAFHLGMRIVQLPDITQWTARSTILGLHPVLVAACGGYAVVGSIAAMAARPWRRVGLSDAALRCRACGYLLIGLVSGHCPECGGVFSENLSAGDRGGGLQG